MSIFLFEEEEQGNSKINIDDLYEKKQKRDLKQVSIFNKILNRIHKRIQHTARNKYADTYIWFHVPEYIVGEPIYDKGECIGFLVSKLDDNGFHVKYMHPNTLFISWHNWIPSYVRNEIKKKMGIVLDEKGNILEKKEDDESLDNKILNIHDGQHQKEQKQYNSIKNYKPTGNLVYSNDMLEKLEKKITFAK
jgi:hypothetical protein